MLMLCLMYTLFILYYCPSISHWLLACSILTYLQCLYCLSHIFCNKLMMMITGCICAPSSLLQSALDFLTKMLFLVCTDDYFTLLAQQGRLIESPTNLLYLFILHAQYLLVKYFKLHFVYILI